MISSENDPKPFTGKHMLAIMVVFFGVIIAVNMTMAVLASKSWTGLVVENSYVASQEFNDHLIRSREQEKLGWTAPLRLTTEEAIVELRDANAKPLRGADVVLVLKRPITDRDDHTVLLQEVAPGLYQAEVNLAPVEWSASLRVKAANGVPFRADHLILLKTE